MIFTTVLAFLTLAPLRAADADTDADGLSDLEETAPGQFEVITNEVTSRIGQTRRLENRKEKDPVTESRP